MGLFCDCKTDEEKGNFFLSGRAVETGVIAPAISNDVAMAYHRCAQFKKENDALRAKIERMERQEPVFWYRKRSDGAYEGPIHNGNIEETRKQSGAWHPLYTLPGAQPAPSVPVDLITDYLVSISAHLAHQDDPKAQAEIGELLRMLAAAPEAKP